MQELIPRRRQRKMTRTTNQIEIRNLDKVCLNEAAYRKLVEKYSSRLKYKVCITFDSRVTDCFGLYIFDSKNTIHIIKISPKKCCFNEKRSRIAKVSSKKYRFDAKNVKLDRNAQKYNIVSTTIHELYHAWQKEKEGRKFYNNKFSYASGVRNKEFRSLYSKCEIVTRVYENKNLMKAIKLYDLALSDEVC